MQMNLICIIGRRQSGYWQLVPLQNLTKPILTRATSTLHGIWPVPVPVLQPQQAIIIVQPFPERSECAI
jgi:hypothetical protein